MNANVIYLVFGNHIQSPVQLEDYFDVFASNFSKVDIEIRYSIEPVLGARNIFIEHFLAADVERVMKATEQNGTKYVVLATEFLTGDSFNSFRNDEKGNVKDVSNKSAPDRIYSFLKGVLGDRAKAALHRIFPGLFPGSVRLIKNVLRLNRNTASSERASQYDGNDSYWRNRFDNFCKVVERAEAIWIVSPDQLEGYRRKFPRKPIHLLPFPESSRFDFGSFRSSSDHIDRDIDVLFSGNSTPYRRLILDELVKAGLNVVEIPNITPSIVRMQLMARSKIGIQLSQNEYWPYTSLMRLHQHLIRGIPIVAEKPLKLPLGRWACAEFVDREKFIERVVQIVTSEEWKSLGPHQQSRYNDSLRTSKVECGRLLSCFEF